ncbi:unnamed protein product [Didymodactylos carnosus]|uniref:HTH CENPB-type domain-containing protein n=1 Tax=Didymodactylos carnosus TaxID=1234261 RepID=A0A8S2VHU5_9BILA|nr:unnamed protein product [Didymodactylos carnosus]
MLEHFGPGRPAYFTVEEEKHLATALTVLQEWGEPLTTHDFLTITAVYARELGRPNMFSNEIAGYDWYNGFMKGHAAFKLKTPQPLEKSRGNVSGSTVTKWFDLTESIFEKHKLIDKPSQIFNCDETGFSDNKATPKVIVRKNKKFTYQR